MAKATLEQRVSELERQVAELRAALERPNKEPDWRDVLGMFTGDKLMQEIDAAGRAIREKEREQARRKRPARQRAKQ